MRVQENQSDQRSHLEWSPESAHPGNFYLVVWMGFGFEPVLEEDTWDTCRRVNLSVMPSLLDWDLLGSHKVPTQSSTTRSLNASEPAISNHKTLVSFGSLVQKFPRSPCRIWHWVKMGSPHGTLATGTTD